LTPTPDSSLQKENDFVTARKVLAEKEIEATTVKDGQGNRAPGVRVAWALSLLLRFEGRTFAGSALRGGDAFQAAVVTRPKGN